MSSNLLTRRERCRACRGLRLERVLSLGKTPAANAFLKKEDLDKPEHYFPLEIYLCHDCSLLQLVDIVSPEFLFRDYVYISSFSPVFIKHFESFANDVAQKFNLGKNSLVVDVGSNDGILLKPFKKYGVRVLGVDPAVKIAEQATLEGVETVPEFLTSDVARAIVSKHGHVDVVTGSNVFAHVDDLDELVEAIKILLKPEGVFIVEAPYLVDFLDKHLFDTIYHEHVSYYAVKPLTVLFGRLGMEVFNVEKVASHGGSLRVFVEKKGGKHKVELSVAEYLANEKARKLDSVATYAEFAGDVARNKEKLISMLSSLKESGAKIAGYGAAAKGNTLLNYFGIHNGILDYIVDDSAWKQGLYTPGTHIPVVARTELERNKPDYVVLLAWNYADAIIKNLADFKAKGGKFVVPVPEPHLV
ncbi:MAG: class I SAM-dependent methyltransferase [Candidatus Ryanbacteria bacterium]|nr:class I SAM-dependent methyltransferase [Candidatus Ryanbacteria bacterium]